jgi:hypothetical protein
MATKHEVTSISKTIAQNGEEMITHIGGNGSKKRSWKISQQEAISGIENNIWDFFIKKGSHNHKLIVAISSLGNKYLKIENDNVELDKTNKTSKRSEQLNKKKATGDDIIINGEKKNATQIKQIAQISILSGSRIIIRNVGKKTTDELIEVAEIAQDLIIFEF